MKQRLVTSRNREAFTAEVNKYLDDGWEVFDISARVGGAGSEGHYTIITVWWAVLTRRETG